MKKDLRIKIASYVIASAIAFINTYCIMFTSVAFADDSDDEYTIKSAGVVSWDGVTDELARLGDMYVSSLYGSTPLGSASIISDRYDIPASWVSTMVNNKTYVQNYCIAPVSDVAYYLDGDTLNVYDPHNRTGRSGGAGQNRFAVSGATDFIFNSDFFKSKIDYWSDYYIPKDNVDQYIYSLNTGSKKNTDGTYPYYFKPYCPIYTDSAGSSTGWGFKGWPGGVYVLPFHSDDDDLFPYYGNYYFHFYSSRTDDGTLNLICDFIELGSDEVAFTYTCVWSTSYPTVAFDFSNYPYVYFYDNYFNYCASKVSNKDQRYVFNQNTTYMGMISGTISSPTSSNNLNLRNLSTFDPISNSDDDFGYILSSNPFTLWAYQTDIDTSRIPDNYYINYGDNIYNYTITDPSTGKGTTINNFITNNYTIGDGGSSGGDTINNWNISFGDFLIDIGNTIQTSITAVFVPSDVVLEGYQTQLSDTINLKIPFVNDIGSILNSLFVDIRDGNIIYTSNVSTYAASSDEDETDDSEEASPPPDLVEGNSDLYIYPKWKINVSFFGQDMELTILDFAMYADVLYYVRIVVAAFVYLTFFVNLYRYLPKLIGGVGDMTNSVMSISKGDDD